MGMGPRPVQTPQAISEPTSYKAVVMLYLGGGVDSFNLIVPLDCPLYTEYQQVRQDIALTSEQLLEISTTGQACDKFGVNCRLPFLKELYDEGSATFVSNVGA